VDIYDNREKRHWRSSRKQGEPGVYWQPMVDRVGRGRGRIDPHQVAFLMTHQEGEGERQPQATALAYAVP